MRQPVEKKLVGVRSSITQQGTLSFALKSVISKFGGSRDLVHEHTVIPRRCGDAFRPPGVRCARDLAFVRVGEGWQSLHGLMEGTKGRGGTEHGGTGGSFEFSCSNVIAESLQ
eukprot:7381910-Pyramimonas_sp.AAC.1